MMTMLDIPKFSTMLLSIIFICMQIDFAQCRDKFVLKKDMTGKAKMPIRYGKSIDTFFNDGRFYGWTSQHSENKGKFHSFGCIIYILFILH